ncbi:MAG TPA: acyl-CoA dehydrogenase family protein [Myxococcota bacterium]|jgi:alkylation response protein AidB-like acyl-CoA dehydrogenase|nr:acyl-CoA dehydrogenase family protein [Myxococcota bacterium]
MDLRFTEGHERFRAELRSWLRTHLKRPWIEELRDPANDEDRLFEIRRAWQRQLNEAGYLGMDWPREWGGRGATAVEKAIFTEETYRADAPPIPNVLGISLLGPALIHHGSEEQRRRFIPKMLSAEEIWCQGFSEPDAGSDLAALRTRAEADGENFRLTGQKVWTTFGPWSDWIFVLARTDMGDRYGGITFFLVPLEQPGVEVRGIKQISGESEFGEVFFDGALAKREHVVGKLGEGWRIAMTVLSYERGAMSLAYPAQYDGFLEDLIQGCRENGTLSRPDVREKLGRLLVENEVLRSNGMRNLAMISSGKAPGPEASIEKIGWSEYAKRLSDAALDLLGLQAQLKVRSPHARREMDWAYEALWCRAGTIYAGSSEIQRNILARRVLKLPAA